MKNGVLVLISVLAAALGVAVTIILLLNKKHNKHEYEDDLEYVDPEDFEDIEDAEDVDDLALEDGLENDDFDALDDDIDDLSKNIDELYEEGKKKNK